jgi:hypothetical protein
VDAPGLAQASLVQAHDDLGDRLRHRLERPLAMAYDRIAALGNFISEPAGRDSAFRRLRPCDGRDLERVVQPPLGGLLGLFSHVDHCTPFANKVLVAGPCVCGDRLLPPVADPFDHGHMSALPAEHPARLMTPRLRREYRTMECMVKIWCADRHGPVSGRAGCCRDCQAFLEYAARRLEKCPYGEAKPTCAKCPIHCYKRAQRELARDIMRYAGPRMTLRHPWLSFMHVVDKLRRVEHPMDTRRRKARRDR